MHSRITFLAGIGYTISEYKHSLASTALYLLVTSEERATIMVSRTVKTRFQKFIGIPKKYKSESDALQDLLDHIEGGSRDKKKEDVGRGAGT
jgi:hypothetical protein